MWHIALPAGQPRPTRTDDPIYILAEQNSLLPIPRSKYASFNPKSFQEANRATKRAIIEEVIESTYPEKAKLLSCIVRKESTWGQNMVGDNGLAYGYFQIHIDKHPVDKDCAMDLGCSLVFTYEKIQEGKGYLWTTYNPCLQETQRSLGSAN